MGDTVIIIKKVTPEVLEALEGFDYELVDYSNANWNRPDTSVIATIGPGSLDERVFLPHRLKDGSGIVISAGGSFGNKCITSIEIREMDPDIRKKIVDMFESERLGKKIGGLMRRYEMPECQVPENPKDEFSPFGKKEYHIAKNMWKRPLTFSKKARRGVHHLKRNKTKNRKRKG